MKPQDFALIALSMIFGVVVFMYSTKIVVHLADDPSVRVEYPLRRLFRRRKQDRDYNWLAKLVTLKLELYKEEW